MTSGICVHMNGAICAEAYCDYFNLDTQRCSRAEECHARVEIMKKFLEKMDELLAKAKDAEAVAELMREMNAVVGPNTTQ